MLPLKRSEGPSQVTDIGQAFGMAAALVRAWGGFSLPDGRTVEDALTIEGLPLWSAISPSLAFGRVSQLLLRPSSVQLLTNLEDLAGLVARRAKRLALDVRRSVTGTRRGCAAWPGRPAFVFLGFSPPMYRETLRPVAERLAERHEGSVVVLDDLPAGQRRDALRGDLNFQSLSEHWHAEAAQTQSEMRRALREVARVVMAPRGLPNALHGRLTPRAFRHLLDWIFKIGLPSVITSAAIARHIIRRHRPILLVSPDVNDARTRAFCFEGKLAGIRTLEIQFGFYGPNDIEWQFFQADRLAVTGESNLEVMCGHGVPRERMTVTGSPRYDGLLSSSSEDVSRTRKALGISAGKRMVLFASQPFYYGVFSSPEVRLEMARALFDATIGLEGLVLVVKPHPAENPSALRRLVGGRNVVWAERETDIRTLIRATDVFVTFFSGTAFDALVLQKPTINLAFPGACANTLFEHCGATTVARSAAQIAQIMRSLDRGEVDMLSQANSIARDEFLRQWFHRLDGRAAERIEALALEMAAEQGGGAHSSIV